MTLSKRSLIALNLGYSLIEITCVLALTAILLTFATPSLSGMVAKSRLNSAANNLIGNMRYAKATAISANTPTSVCQDDTCSVQSKAAPGGQQATLQVGIDGVGSDLKLTQRKTLWFSGEGLGYTTNSSAPFNGLVADIASNSHPEQGHRCVYLELGTLIHSCADSVACAFSQGAPNETCH